MNKKNKTTISILHETKNFLVIDKPAGLITHPSSPRLRRAGGDGKTNEPSVVDWVLETYPELAEIGEPWHRELDIPRAGIVHRLDRDTSGCLLIAKNQDTFEYFKQQFQDRKVQKVYTAVVYGYVKQNEGTIDVSIARSSSDFRKWSAQRGKRGKEREALTEYKVLERIEQNDEKYSLVEFYPKTGRTHQIRVHAKYMNHPVVGDQLYAGKLTEKTPEVIHQLLHASKLVVIDPQDVSVSVSSPLPHVFHSFFNIYYTSLV